MNDLRSYLFTILMLSVVPFCTAAGQEFSLNSGTLKIVATLSLSGQEPGGNATLSFRSFPGGKLLKTMTSEGFERPMMFRYHGENFIHVSTTPVGSGGFETDTIFWIAPDETMHEIGSGNAAGAYEIKVGKTEMVLAGGSGVNCVEGKLEFEFYIANDDDPHCCPTAGKVTGNYEIVGKREFNSITGQYSSTFRMVVKQYSRTPISTSEMSASLVR